VVALGGVDGVVTVWRTDQPRPVVVLREAFKDSVTDLSWSPDGYRQAVAHNVAHNPPPPRGVCACNAMVLLDFPHCAWPCLLSTWRALCLRL
jgi:hypothetical protein